jgi:transcriptional regulator GlxA family with amidase domain
MTAMARHILFLVYPGFVLLDLSGPLEAFTNASPMAPPGYRLTVASLDGGMVPSACGLQVATEPLAPCAVDTFVVVGRPEPPDAAWAAPLVQAIREMSACSRRTACVCTGAFLLAASGLLDGRVATTHWCYAPKLRERHPELRVDSDRIWTEDGGFWTSAGMSAGIDMSLAMIEQDLGRDVARAVARMLVVYYRRPSGQGQYSSLLALDPDSDRIRRTLGYAREHLREDLSVERLADVAHLSARQFGRVFAAATGMTPARAIERLRVETARPQVEDGTMGFEEIACKAGFTDADHMCRSFLRVVEHTPQDLRRSARRHLAPVH